METAVVTTAVVLQHLFKRHVVINLQRTNSCMLNSCIQYQMLAGKNRAYAWSHPGNEKQLADQLASW